MTKGLVNKKCSDESISEGYFTAELNDVRLFNPYICPYTLS